jgi:hypothetical protein
LEERQEEKLIEICRFYGGDLEHNVFWNVTPSGLVDVIIYHTVRRHTSGDRNLQKNERFSFNQ